MRAWEEVGRQWSVWSAYTCVFITWLQVSISSASLIGMGQEDYVIFALHCQMMELKIHVA
jgi:hypothetical protein